MVRLSLTIAPSNLDGRRTQVVASAVEGRKLNAGSHSNVCRICLPGSMFDEDVSLVRLVVPPITLLAGTADPPGSSRHGGRPASGQHRSADQHSALCDSPISPLEQRRSPPAGRSSASPRRRSPRTPLRASLSARSRFRMLRWARGGQRHHRRDDAGRLAQPWMPSCGRASTASVSSCDIPWPLQPIPERLAATSPERLSQQRAFESSRQVSRQTAAGGDVALSERSELTLRGERWPTDV